MNARSSWRVWVAAARPRTLTVALAPVALGTAIAWRDDAVVWTWAGLALLGALLLQIGANYANDYFDWHKGADRADRLGPTRLTAAGLVSPAAMKRGFLCAFLLSACVGAALVWRGGWPVLAIGVAGIAAGVLYTGGPKPLGWMGLGEAFAFLFFGPLAVAGTHYVQAGSFSALALALGCGPGLLAAALLALNNLRDVDGDRRAGKHTLAVRWGRGFARTEIAVCLLGALAVPPLGMAWAKLPATSLLASGAILALGPKIVRRIWRAEAGDRLLDVLAQLGALAALYGLLFAVGLVLD